MKRILLIFVVSFFGACQGGDSSKDSLAGRMKNVNDDKSKSGTLVLKKEGPSTLDSLQGVWSSVTDRKERVIFKGNKYYSIYESDTSVFTVYLSGSCLFKDTVAELSGNVHIILVDDKYKDSPLCYELDYLTNKKMSMVYSGHYLTYDKE